MKLDVISFKDKQPKRGKIICFSEDESKADFYSLDNAGWAWINCLDECEFACAYNKIQEYGNYSHWARIRGIFDIKFNIPKDE